jgi:hypothetical protein
VAGLALPLEWVSDSNRQQQQQEAAGGLPSAQQVFSRISSGSSSGRQEAAAGQLGSSSSQGGGVSAGLAAAEKEYLAHQIAALRISLAKRDADVARLEGEYLGRQGNGCMSMETVGWQVTAEHVRLVADDACACADRLAMLPVFLACVVRCVGRGCCAAAATGRNWQEQQQPAHPAAHTHSTCACQQQAQLSRQL